MNIVGRKGRIHWPPTGEWYRTRVVDYNVVSGLHKVVWLDEWTFSELRLGSASQPEEGIYGFWLDNAPRRNTLPGKRIILEPTWTEFFEQYGTGNGIVCDYRACVVQRANGGEFGYFVFYLTHNVTATVDLQNVRFEVLDPSTDMPLEIRNPTKPKIDLDPPLLLQDYQMAPIEYISADSYFV